MNTFWLFRNSDPPPLFSNLYQKSIVFFKPFPILNYGIQFNSYAKRLQVEFKIFLGHKTFTFHDSSMSSLDNFPFGTAL